MKMASIINQYRDPFMAQYGERALPGHIKAINAICGCRTPASGELYAACPECGHGEWKPLSCGHRSCPQCQNHEASQWVDRQQGKLLPVPYFLITFTLPYELRSLASVFRARFLTALNDAEFPIPKQVPQQWVVDCSHAGKGITAVKYLSRYLYRGVISEKNIVSNENGMVTFKYTESKTDKIRFRTLKGEDFLKLIMQHLLPKEFRRVRDYGFLHSNAKKLLLLVQLILHVKIKRIEQRPRPVFKCPLCDYPMVIPGFRQALEIPG